MSQSKASIVACPLRYEASLIRRGLRAAQSAQGCSVETAVQCCGLGAMGVQRWSATQSIPQGATVVLAGTSGSLRDEIRAGQAFVIDEIRDSEGARWTPPLATHAGARVVITSVNTIVSGVDDRRALGLRTGAHLVDWESVEFARIACERGWKWGVVRGVSDDFATNMPGNMSDWLTPDGGMRIGRVAASILRRPATLRELRCLHHNSKEALRNAAILLMRNLSANLEKVRET